MTSDNDHGKVSKNFKILSRFIRDQGASMSIKYSTNVSDWTHFTPVNKNINTKLGNSNSYQNFNINFTSKTHSAQVNPHLFLDEKGRHIRNNFR